MEDDLGAGGGDRGADRGGVGDVAAVAAREAADLGAERAQPQRQPAALEAGVAGDQDPPPGPERRVGQRARHAVTLCDDPAIATVRILGAGGWIPTGTHATCSALLREGDAAVLIDAGTGVERLVADRSLLDGVEHARARAHPLPPRPRGRARLLAGAARRGRVPAAAVGPGAACSAASTDECSAALSRAPFADADFGLIASRGPRAGGGAAIGPFTLRTRPSAGHSTPTLALRFDDASPTAPTRPTTPATPSSRPARAC